MDKEKLVKKLEDGVSALREQLEKNEGSALAAVASNARAGFESLRSGFESLKTEIMEKEAAKKAAESIKGHLEDLENAVKKGDKKMSAKAVELMEKAIKELKEKK